MQSSHHAKDACIDFEIAVASFLHLWPLAHGKICLTPLLHNLASLGRSGKASVFNGGVGMLHIRWKSSLNSHDGQSQINDACSL